MADFVQTDTSSEASIAAYCSGGGAGIGATADSLASIGGTPGTTPQTVGVSPGDNNIYAVIVDYGQRSTWGGPTGTASGNATLKLNVSTGTGTTGEPVSKVSLCRLNASDVNQETIGENTSPGHTLIGGVLTTTVACSEASFAEDDRLVAIYLVSKPTGMSPVSPQITPDQTDSIPLQALATTNKGGRFIADIPLSQYG